MTAPLRRSFVVHARDGEAFVIQDLMTFERACLASLEQVMAKLQSWLRPQRDADQTTWAATRRHLSQLTRSETRVAQLAADGLTNRQIAAALGVQLRTVESHLTAAFRKTEVASRHGLAGVVKRALG